MRRSSQFNPLSAMKSLFFTFSALFLVLSALGGNALATTPIAVSVYQDMESGNNGDALTASIMNASSHGYQNWSAPAGTLWVSTAYHRDLPGPVFCGGVTYNGTGGSRSWKFSNTNMAVYVKLSYGSFSEVTEACYYTTLTTLTYQVGYDVLNNWGGSFQCIQTLGSNNSGGQGLALHLHSNLPSTSYALGTNNNPLMIPITTGKTYWITSNYDGSIGACAFAVFDPDNSFAQVGTTLHAVSLYNDTENQIWLGRNDAHGNQTNDLTYAYFDQFLVDSDNGTFPLLPSGANDTTAPPAPPVVRDGTGMDQSIALSTTQLSANWDPPVDPESGIKAYQYAIGTTQGGTNVVNWTTLKNMRAITKTGLTLTTGQTYYFSVKAINGVGLTGPATNSNGQTVGTDSTGPSAPAIVRDGGDYNVSPDADCDPNPHELTVNWDPATDNESGISFYQFAFGTTVGATDVLGWTNCPANALNWQGLGLNGWAPNLNPPNGVAVGARYYATVRAINNAGITGPAANTDGQIVVDNTDTTPPSAPPVVRDGTASTETSTTSSTTQLSANWDNASDPQSGIYFYQYNLGTTPGGTQLASQVRVEHDAPVSRLTVTGLNLTVGQTYYFGVRSVNGKWNTSGYTNSSGVTVVSGGNQAPSAPANVRDGTGADITYTTSNTQLSANWDASTDPDGSVTAYQHAIGTTAGGTQTVNWTTLGNVTTVTKTGLSLTNGQTYYFSVKAVDNQGLAGNATNSNGQTVDTTAPSAPANVRDGTGTDISTTSSTTQLSANWDASADAESGISGYQYAIGTSAGGTQTVNWTSLGNVTTVTKTGLTLSVGQTYYFSVKAVNNAGLVGSATNSNGQTVVSVGNVVYFSDNFESWTVHGGAWSSVNGESSTHTLNTSVDYAKAGAKGLKITDSDTTATTGASLTKNFSPVISGDIYVRFFIFLPTGYGSANSTCTRRILRVYMDAGNYTVVSLSGAALAIAEVGGWTGTAATPISENAWHCVELHVAPPSASTAIQYWIDGTSAGTCTGTYSGNSTFTYIQFGDVALASGSANGTGTIYWDELVVSNFYNGTVASVTYFQDNFENWTVHGGAWSSISGESSNHTINTSTDYARSGTKSLKVTDSDTTASYGVCLVKTFSPVITTDIYVRFYIFLPIGFNATNSGCARRVLRVFCGTNRGQVSFSPTSTFMEEVGAWGLVTGPALSENAWHCVEMHIAPPSASTALQYWIDGTSAGTLTANFSTSSSFDTVQLGDVSYAAGNNGTGTYYFDEAVVSDSYIDLLP